MNGISEKKHRKSFFIRLIDIRNLRFCLAAICLFAVCLTTAQAAPPPPAASPCDPNYYDSLRSRAWLEAQREITQNQNLIFKPDSVLEYTCFDLFASEVAADALNMFSENTRWGSILPSTQTDSALENLIGVAMRAYLTSNFSHTFLGGRTTIDYSPQGSITGGVYNCDRMQQVWMQSKCMNFMSNATQDGFFTFAQYQADPEKRALPNPCASIAATWQTNIDRATVDAQTPWTEDNVVTYFNNLDPVSCNNPVPAGVTAATPVETGIWVVRSQTTPTRYNEKVCIAPGCYYVPTGVNTGTCQGP